MNKKLYRSKNDRMIAGVCGGLADYFNVDSSLVRLAVLFIFLFQGIGLVAYIIAWLVMSEEPAKNEYRMPDDYYIEDHKKQADRAQQQEYNAKANNEQANNEANGNYNQDNKAGNEREYYQQYQEQNQDNNTNNRRKLFAVIMILVGSIFLIDIWIPDLYWEKYWPLILIAAGVLMLKGDNND